MMIFLMTMSTAAYVGLVYLCSKRAIKEFVDGLSYETAKFSSDFRTLVAKKELLNLQKIRIKEDFFKIFTLYEMTKDITKKLHREEAFAIFNQKLNEHIVFKECRLLASDALELKLMESKEEWFLFPLLSEKKIMGILAVLDMNPEDRDKFSILGHQFALAMRRIELYEEVEQIAITDGLTESFNRRYLMQRLEEEFNRSKLKKMRMALLMIDVDNFKKINDNYGHLTGDQVLRQTAALIKSNIREIDIAGRYGGEEFCVVLPDTDLAGAQYAAERIREAIAQAPIKAYDTNVVVTASVGAATFPKDASSTTDLIEQADQALYKAKELGRNRVVFFAQVKK